ncbi:MAG: phosphotransferase [Bryobacteraceae bacterium]
MTVSSQLAGKYPGTFLLDQDDLVGVQQYLRNRRWIGQQDVVCRAARAGEGNMNCTLRIQTAERSFILKQARPWVEKYPEIPAPWSRGEMEARFYRAMLSNTQLAEHMPKLLAFDSLDHILMLEDLGPAQDFTFLYRREEACSEETDCGVLVRYLVALHGSFRDCQLAEDFLNDEMRALNHEHIFAFPLRPGNGLDLNSITPGLAGLALKLQADSAYTEQVRNLGNVYLDHSYGRCLVHGDYFPGSWLKTSDRLYVIDPEFCFFGPPELDLGMMIGHLYLAGVSERIIEDVTNLYTSAVSIDTSLALAFAGVEIMRRLIGVAQVQLRYGLEEKGRLFELSRTLVLN